MSDFCLELLLFLNIFGSFPVTTAWGAPWMGAGGMDVLQMLVSVAWPWHVHLSGLSFPYAQWVLSALLCIACPGSI